MSNHGLDLYRAGYHDLVLIRKGQKAPARTGWLHDRPSADNVRGWGGSFGLIAQEFPGIDIDVYDEELSRQLVAVFQKQLGPAPLRLSHRPASKLLVYRTEEPFRKKVLHLPDDLGMVEILGEGRQYLVAGEHPDGPPHYRWAEWELWKWPPHKLSVITEEQVDALLDTLAQKLGGFVGRKSSSADVVVPTEELRAPSVEAVRELVGKLPNTDAFLAEHFPEQPTPRDYWVAMGMAVKGAAGEPGEQVFVDWTARYEDGPVDLDDARGVYQGLVPERYGWPTLQRIKRERNRVPAAEAFEIEPAPEGYEPPLPAADVKEHVHGSDEFYAEEVLARLRHRFRYMAGGWKHYQDQVWLDDETKEGLVAQLGVRKVLRRLALRLVGQAEISGDQKMADKMMSAARGLQGRTRISAVHSLLKAHLLEDPDNFDQDDFELNTPNGVINLKTGELRPGGPEDLMTRITEGAPTQRYDPSQAPVWESFLDYFTDGDDELRAFLQRWAGYCLTGRMNEKKFSFLWGAHPHTGKSTFINAISYALGSYAASADIELFMGGMPGDMKAREWARLAGTRLVTATEPSVGQRWDDSAIKRVTGGDPVTARQIYREAFEYYPTFKIMIGGNNEPELRVAEEAMLSRIMIVPANHVVPEEKRDPHMDIKLEAEVDAILAWCLAGCRAWQEQGLQPPKAVQETTEAYAEEEDRIGRWLEEMCDLGKDKFTSSKALYKSWKQWCGARGAEPMGYTAFGRELSGRLKVTKTRAKQGDSYVRGYEGIALLPRQAVLGEDV